MPPKTKSTMVAKTCKGAEREKAESAETVWRWRGNRVLQGRKNKVHKGNRLQAKGNGKGIYGLYMGEADISNLQCDLNPLQFSSLDLVNFDLVILKC